jgi:GNAT superfamily N-acetyltransferase
MDKSRIYGYEINEAFKIESKIYTDNIVGFLRKIAVLRWGNDDRLDSWINDLKNSPRPSFFIFANSDSSNRDNIIGLAYFFHDETDEKRWYYSDLTAHPKYRRLGIFRRLVVQRHLKSGRLMSYINPQIAERMIDLALIEMKIREASKLCTYIDKNNKSSILLHKKLGFIPNENEIDKGGRILYENNIFGDFRR